MSATATELTEATFQQQVGEGVALVDFWAPWCGPCRMVAPVLDELASELGEEVTIAKVNVDDNPVLAGRFRVSAIPLLVLLKDGQEVTRFVGLQSKADLTHAIQATL